VLRESLLMKSSKHTLACLCAISLICFLSSARAQQPTEKATPPQPEPAPLKPEPVPAKPEPAAAPKPEAAGAPKPAAAGAADPDSAAVAIAADTHPQIRRRILGLLRLRESMDKELQLTDEQRKKLDKLFDDYYAGIKRNRKRVGLQPAPGEIVPPEELPKLKEKLAEARSAGDAAAVKDLTTKIGFINSIEQPSALDPIELFLNHVSVVLTPPQREGLVKLVDRWKIIEPGEIGKDGPFRRLIRSSRDPALGLTEERLKEVEKILKDALDSATAADRRDLEKMTALTAKTRLEVFEKLTPEQRAQVDKSIAMLERWAKIEQASEAKAFRDAGLRPGDEKKAPEPGTATPPPPTPPKEDKHDN